MNQKQSPMQFLEPVYLNQTMVMNCATYLFKGVPVESTQTASTNQTKETSAGLSLPAFTSALALSARFGSTKSVQQSALSRSEVGGLHMDVVDELKKQKMVAQLKAPTNQELDKVALLNRYVEIEATLQPTEYFGLLEMLSNFGPLVLDLADTLYAILEQRMEPGSANRTFTPEQIRKWIAELDQHGETILSTIQKLVDDYLASGQLEMQMILPDGRPIGIVDLDLQGMNARMLKARLAGGNYHIYGKVTSMAKQGDELGLLQRTMMVDAIAIYQRFKKLSTNDNGSASSAPSTASSQPIEGEGFQMIVTDTTSTQSRKQKPNPGDPVAEINKLIAITMPGPAVRIAAMSVCI